MGSGRDKRKKAKPKAPGAGAEKTARKTQKNDAKAEQRAVKKAQGGDDDIDALLAAMKVQGVKEVVVEDDCAPPSARSCACLVAHTTKKDTLILYGGEWFDGAADKTYVYGDLYLYDAAKDRWKKVVAPNGPLPRSSAQAVVHRNFLYVFGGEVCSPSGRNFKHHRDLWRLDLESYEWEQLPGRGGPSARSGHRMALWKNRLLLFGGFYETATEGCRYFNDLWSFDLEDLAWQSLSKAGTIAPRPRGGCQIVVHQEAAKLYLFGGHCVEILPDKSEKETVFNDLWQLDLKSWQWERLKMAGMAPGPRASFNMVGHRQRAILFGGITDQPGKGDRLFSQAHDELYQLNFVKQRWGPLVLRPPTKGEKQEAAVSATAEQSGLADRPASDAEAAAAAAAAAAERRQADDGSAAQPSGEDTSEAAVQAKAVMRPDMDTFLQRGNLDANSALHKAVVRIQARFRGYVVRKAYKTYQLGGKLNELLYSPALYGVDLSGKDMPKPRARSNAMMTVSGDTLWLFGGIVEVALNDVTLDDLWQLNLKKLDGWRCVRENTAGEDAFKDEDWESASDEGAAAGGSDSD